jgi:hypothetical protein
MTRRVRRVSIAALAAGLGCCVVLLTVADAAQATNDNRLLSLFASIKQNRGVSPEGEKGLQAVMESVPSMSGAQVSEAIPAIVAAFSALEEPVHAVAALACFAISQRPDGTQLLEKALPALASLLESRSERVAGMAHLVIVNARTKLAPEVMSRIIAAMNQQDRSVAERVPALATAVARAPADPVVIEAVTRLMLEPMDASTKASVLTAIRNSLIDTGPLRLIVIAWLQESDARVKLGAMSVLTRMGPAAIDAARFELRRIAQGETESQEVRAAAAKALQSLE